MEIKAGKQKAQGSAVHHNTVRPMRLALAAMTAATALLAAACSGEPSMPQPASRLLQQPFGRTPEGQGVEIVTLSNASGIEVRVITYGGIVVSIRTPDRHGRVGDVVLGHDQVDGYVTSAAFFGTLVGRYANRIAKGKFTLDGREYTLATNNGANHLHGGRKGWDKAVWTPEAFNDRRGVGVSLTHVSPDGDEGYPGTVKATVTYTLKDTNELQVDYLATTDRPTIINLTQHSYFNLSGGAAPDILGHELTINADRYTPVDAGLIPSGELAPVQGTPFDFRRATAIGARIDQDHGQLRLGRGYDHNFVLNRPEDGLSLAATAYEPVSGRTMDVLTTEPGVQFYTGNFLDGTISGKGGVKYGRRAGFCLETQHFPDSPNRPDFPSTVLRPDQTYRSTTVFRFGVRR
jgi:aldose 1-epimerase